MTIHDKDPIFRFTFDKYGHLVLPGCLRAAMGIHTGDQIVITSLLQIKATS